MLCICGFCIPLNALWPIVLFVLRPIWNYIGPWFTGKPADDKKKTTPSGMVCDGDSCCMVSKPKQLIKDDINLLNISEVEDDVALFTEVKQAKDGSLVRFTAPWCKPCKEIEPEFIELSKKYKQIVFATVDVDASSDIALDAGVIALPAFHFYRNGDILGQTKGSKLEAIQDLLDVYVSVKPSEEKPKSD